MTYDSVREFVASFGTIYFGTLFTIALVYALLPSRRKQFEEAAQIPLRED
jgi:cytochrome c oxidase cbb3-type subunit IV